MISFEYQWISISGFDRNEFREENSIVSFSLSLSPIVCVDVRHERSVEILMIEYPWERRMKQRESDRSKGHKTMSTNN